MTNSFFISLNSVSKVMKTSSPGDYTKESIVRARELTEDITKQIAKGAREIAQNAGKKRVTEEEIKMSAKFLFNKF